MIIFVIKTRVLLMEPLPSISKIYLMVIHEESNNIVLLLKPDGNANFKESNPLINAYDARKFKDRGKNHTFVG